MTNTRPDPDLLLAQLREEETRAQRGRLRIYFGASAGVGKTYAMLLAARKLQHEGQEVVIGVIETHGRTETASLLEGLEVLPAASVPYRDRRLPEFDIDGALRRHPQLILVDELAHTNVPGSRHPKRWQDVEELLSAGIDVYTTLNVQHLESLNDVVGGITGIRVQETLPDTFFDRADEVVLVDTPAEELLARLKAGKVYVPAQAERAASHFFRRGNLMALRELALRRTADRVEEDVQAYRADQAIEPVWQTEAALLCCIGIEPGSERVVRSAARLAQQLNVSWHAVYVETPALQRLPDSRREQILQTVRLAEELGATTAVLTGDDIGGAILHYARRRNLSKMVLGRSSSERWRGPPLPRRLARQAPDIDIIEIGRNPSAPEPAPALAAEHADEERETQRRLRYLWAMLISAGTTVLAMPLIRHIDLANIVMLFLLSVVGVAIRFGRGPAVLAAFANVAAFDYFFVAPRYSFAVSDVQYLITFLVMLGVGLFTGQLTAGLRFQARVAARREERARALYEVARDLSRLLQVEDVVRVSRQTMEQQFASKVAIFLLDRQEQLTPPPRAEDHAGLDLGTARWTLDHRQPAGLGTDTLPGSQWLYLPLKAPMRTRGVLSLRPRNPRLLWVPEQRQLLETFAALIAMALERVHYVDVAQEATLHIESERLRNSLLAALSHDLRTPLAALVGLADTLCISTPPLSPPQADLARSMRDESVRMSAMVANLLDMARIQAGDVTLRSEWQSAEELVDGALQAAHAALSGRAVHVDVPADLPLVECDATLIVRVLVNLLENAAKYTPPLTPITVSARVAGSDLEMAVSDQGPGVAPGKLEVIFDKFTRGDSESATPGVGLGLAICRSIVQAHHGRIWAQNLPQGGARFVFTLPLRAAPAVPMEDSSPPVA